MGVISLPELGPFAPDEYYKPNTLDEVVGLLQKYGERAKIVAGGTLIYELAKRGMIPRTKYLIDVENLKLDYVRYNGGTLTIGSMTKVYELIDNPALAKHPHDLLRETARHIRPVQIRNMATVGGEVCAAVPFLDLPTALLALDSSLRIISPKGERKIPLDGFYQDYFLSGLKPIELLVEVMIPPMPDNTAGAFRKFERTGVDLALLNVAVRITVGKGGSCNNVRIAVGGGRTHMRMKKLEKILEGNQPTEAILNTVANALMEEFNPISSPHASTQYKREIAKVLMREAIRDAYERAGGA